MAVARRAVDLVADAARRRPASRCASRSPGSGWRCRAGSSAELDALLELVRAEANVKVVELIGDESELVDRGVKVLLPRVGKRLGAADPRASWPPPGRARSRSTPTAP